MRSRAPVDRLERARTTRVYEGQRFLKDRPDLSLLGLVRDIEATTLRAAIEQTWAHRGTRPVPSSLPEPPVAWARSYAERARASRLP